VVGPLLLLGRRSALIGNMMDPETVQELMRLLHSIEKGVAALIVLTAMVFIGTMCAN
jgi:hypothetical protein